MQRIGITMVPQSLAKKRHEIGKDHLKEIQDSIGSERAKVEDNWKKGKVSAAQPELDLEGVTQSLVHCTITSAISELELELLELELDDVTLRLKDTTVSCALSEWDIESVTQRFVDATIGNELSEVDMEVDGTKQEYDFMAAAGMTAEVVARSRSTPESMDMSIENEVATPSCNYEIISDNVDITVKPTYMTAEKQNKSLHWFLNLAFFKRVTDPSLPNSKPKANIRNIDNAEFLPNVDDCASLDENFCFHIANILKEQLDFLHEFHVPDCIDHPYMKEMSTKSSHIILDLLEKNENKSDDIIDILQWIHDEFIPHSNDEHPISLERVVFGGDVLTNERAYSGQMAMLNGMTSHERLGGIIHRPEGLHREMNLTLLIYQQFYNQTSGGEKGTLYQLRNLINRRDVKGADSVVSAFRPHFEFLEDVLKAIIVTCAMDHFGLETPQSVPTKHKPPPITLMNAEAQSTWISSHAHIILQKYVKLEEQWRRLQEQTEREQQANVQIESVKDAVGFHCHCGAIFKQRGRYISHALKEHQENLSPIAPAPADDGTDTMASYMGSLVKCLLLLHDTSDAYKFGDAARIFRNAKFELLLYDVGNHTKYRMWMFRTLAYEKAVLTEKESFEYKWNVCSNTKGGKGKNIPNDNVVEIHVKKLKDCLKAQGANVNFENAQLAARTLQEMDAIVENLSEQSGQREKSGKKTSINKKGDIVKLVAELQGADFVTYVDGRALRSFAGFRDLFKRVNVANLSKWLTKQKKTIVLP